MSTETTAQLIEMARRGERIPRQPHSLHDQVKPGVCISHHSSWRTIVCDGDNDIVECYHCGDQRLVSCNFDEDFA